MTVYSNQRYVPLQPGYVAIFAHYGDDDSAPIQHRYWPLAAVLSHEQVRNDEGEVVMRRVIEHVDIEGNIIDDRIEGDNDEFIGVTYVGEVRYRELCRRHTTEVDGGLPGLFDDEPVDPDTIHDPLKVDTESVARWAARETARRSTAVTE